MEPSRILRKTHSNESYFIPTHLPILTLSHKLSYVQINKYLSLSPSIKLAQ